MDNARARSFPGRAWETRIQRKTRAELSTGPARPANEVGANQALEARRLLRGPFIAPRITPGASHAPSRTTRYRRGGAFAARPRRRLTRGPRRAYPLVDGSSGSRGAAQSHSGRGGRLAVSPASPRLGGDAGRIGVARFRCPGACFRACRDPRYRAGNGRNGAYLRRHGGRGRFHHERAHRVMLGRANAKVRAAVVDARRKDERPRAEIQPVRKGRQRQVIAVQHGETLASARDSGGLLGVSRGGDSRRTGRFLDVQCFSSSLGSVSLPGSRRGRTRVRPIRKSNGILANETGRKSARSRQGVLSVAAQVKHVDILPENQVRAKSKKIPGSGAPLDFGVRSL